MTECNDIKEQRRHNTGLAKVAVQCSADTFVVNHPPAGGLRRQGGACIFSGSSNGQIIAQVINGQLNVTVDDSSITEANQTEQSTETQPESESSDNSNLIGEWKGVFGNDQLALTIETVNADGSATGFNIVKGNRRPLTGIVTKNVDSYDFELKEPGDDKWDGVFKFSISGSTAKGSWTANNGKSTKQFSLTK
jgi:hypothetical protein